VQYVKLNTYCKKAITKKQTCIYFITGTIETNETKLLREANTYIHLLFLACSQKKKRKTPCFCLLKLQYWIDAAHIEFTPFDWFTLDVPCEHEILHSPRVPADSTLWHALMQK
jgi:hypothetical protein